MKTSMAYRLYRLYFNSNADNHALFGNRVHNPLNKTISAPRKAANQAAIARVGLALALAAALLVAVQF